MAHIKCVGNLELLNDQGVVHVKELGCFLAMNLEFWAWLGLQLRYFIDICFSQILMIAGTQPLHEAMAEHLVSIILRLNTLFGGQRMQGKVNLARHPAGRYAILLLIIRFVGSMITGAHGELQDEAHVQSCICAAPHTWETRDYALQALAVTTLAAIAPIGVLIPCRMFQKQLLVQAIPIPIPILAAVPAIPAPLQPLPVIAVVQGGGDDIDDVLVRAPIPTRLNSPLLWL